MDIEQLKMLLLSIEADIKGKHPDSPIYFHQQDAEKKNMALMGIEDGTLWISPRRAGFSIGLSGKKLEDRMIGFMEELFSCSPYGYAQKNNRLNKKDLPFWVTDDVEALRLAVNYYLGIKEIEDLSNLFPDEVTEGEYLEGRVKTVNVNAYERNPEARRKCIQHHGTNCSICGFDFHKVYGDLGEGFIHVHHRVPISSIGKEYSLDPIKDLIPVCPNCHAMLHRFKETVSVEELRERLLRKKS